HAGAADEKRERMAPPTDRGPCAADEAAYQRVAPSRKAAIIRQRLGESHADPRAQRRGHAHDKRIPRVSRGDRRGEYGSERRYRSVHQAGETGLHDLEYEQSAPSLLLVLSNFWTQFLGSELLRPIFVRALLLCQVVEELSNARILRAARGSFIEPAGLLFNRAGPLLPPVQSQGTGTPHRFAMHESFDVLTAD